MDDNSSVSRILKLAGILNEDGPMTFAQASELLRSVGVNPNRLDDNEVRRALQGKPASTATRIATAYKIVRSPPKTLPGQPVTKPWVPAPAVNGKQPPWAKGIADWAIRKNDYTDTNYVRKHLWELGGESMSPVTLWCFDGEKFPLKLTVFSKPAAHKEMAKAMIIQSKGARVDAIFMSGGSEKMVLIYLVGKILEKPILFSHQSFNGHPANDWDFIAQLPRKLHQISDRLKRGDGEEFTGDFKAAKSPPEDYKAWVNIKSGQIVPTDANKGFLDLIKANPKMFGMTGNETNIGARIAVERHGWCATGVNVDGEKVGALVTAMNQEQALKAARLLFKARWEHGVWNTLTVKTNDETIKLSGNEQIKVYLKTGERPAPPAEDNAVYV